MNESITKLDELENIIVNTQTVDELDSLMAIYDSSNIKWPGGGSALEGAFSNKRIAQYGKDTCIRLNQGYLFWGSKDYYRNVISFQEFCDTYTSEK